MKKLEKKQLVLIGIRRKGERKFKIQAAGTKNLCFGKSINSNTASENSISKQYS